MRGRDLSGISEETNTDASTSGAAAGDRPAVAEPRTSRGGKVRSLTNSLFAAFRAKSRQVAPAAESAEFAPTPES